MMFRNLLHERVESGYTQVVRTTTNQDLGSIWDVQLAPVEAKRVVDLTLLPSHVQIEEEGVQFLQLPGRHALNPKRHEVAG
jgi:hypothetical protein